MPFIEDAQRFVRRSGTPVTFGLIASFVVLGVLDFLLKDKFPIDLFIFGQGWLTRPWTLLLYPYLEGLDIFLLFLCFWIYWLGSSLERDLGSAKFASVWVAGGVLGALFLSLGGTLFKVPYFAIGSILPEAALTVIWGVRNKTACIRLFMCIPISGFWLAWMTVALVLVNYGRVSVPLGVFACFHLAVAWAFASGFIPGLTYAKPKYRPSKAYQAREQEYFDDVRTREQERQERERLRKLFEGSMNDD